MGTPPVPLPDADFQLGDWLVQPSLRQISGPTGTFRLEPKVMDVLVYLAQRPGQMVSKDEILETVWKDTFVADGALFRHVSELRRLLGDDSKVPRYIQTIPKKGYRLVAPVFSEAGLVAAEGGDPSAHSTTAPPALTAEAGRAGLPAPARSRPWSWPALLVLAVLAAIALVPRWPYRSGQASSVRPNIAVLYFENNSGDPSLDWLRVALADMLVTDLSQSPGLEVLGTDRLYQILSDLKRLDERTVSSGLVRDVAAEAKADSVLVGSFVRAGETIWISAKLQDAKSGKVLMSEKVEGRTDAQLFTMVDELTRRIKDRFDIPRTADLERDLKDVTTGSLEAYRYYVEGVKLHSRYQEDEARVLFDKAIELDPGFAMALARLSIVCFNIGQDRRAEEYARRALENTSRLTPRERYYIEGWYYVRKEETLGRAVDAYTKALEIYPTYASARANLGAIYTALERYEEAVSHLEELRRKGFASYPVYLNLGKAHAALGRSDRAYETLLAFRQRNPDNAAVHRGLAFQLVAWGRLDEGLQMMDKAAQLDPGDLAPEAARFYVSVLREQWEPARAAAAKLAASEDPYWRWLGRMSEAQVRLFRGRSQEALAGFDRAARSDSESGERTALSRTAGARVLMLRGAPARALEEAQQAQVEAAGNLGEWQGLFVAALAQEALGRRVDADATAETLRRKAEAIPSEKEKRRHRHLAGELALARGNAARAVEELTKAQETLSPRGTFAGSELPQHVPIWFALGSAHLAAGDREKASYWLRKVTESGTEHVHWPVPYVRSFYLLGTIYEARGEEDKAYESYRRFVSIWGQADLDREWVADARRKLRLP
jgi:DNA-binding winged helix-turn-helix (wHTH) protein/tetratricopeptide (TPR) repeat protein